MVSIHSISAINESFSHPFVNTNYFFTVSFFKFVYFLIEGEVLYRILLFSVKPQHESAIGIQMSPSS